MSRIPSAETELRNLRRKMKEQDRVVQTLKVEVHAYRTRATQAEQACAEWKQRFDLLLARTPKLKP